MRVPKPLTTTKIANVRPSAKRQALADGGARGLYLVTAAQPSGRKTWEFRFVGPATKKQTSIQLGVYPSMALSDARRAAEEQRAILASGGDPREARRSVTHVVTLDALVREWHASTVDQVKETTRQTALRRLEMHVLPTLGDRDVKTIKPADVQAELGRLKAAGQHETASRTCNALSRALRYAMRRELVDRDVAGIIRNDYPTILGAHHAAITDPAAFGGLLRAIADYRGFVVRQALLFDALTFVRSAELRGAAWTEIDLEGATWTIPAARMKVKDNGDHVVPLSRQAVELLRETHRVTGRGALVFPGLRWGKPLSDATLNAALTTLGFPSDVHRLHGFRSSASTMLNELAAREGYARWNPETIEEQLAHRPTDAVRAAYHRGNQLALRRTMMQAWADEIDRMRGL